MLNRLFKKRQLTDRLVRDESGVSAIEFGILAPIFLTLFFAVFEIGFLFTKMGVMDYAMQKAAKKVYIGQASSGTVTHADLEQTICDHIFFAGQNCTSNLNLELIEISDLSDVPSAAVECQDQVLDINPTVKYNPGTANTTVFMRACMMTDVLTPGVGYGMNLPLAASGKFALVTSTAFKNEPF